MAITRKDLSEKVFADTGTAKQDAILAVDEIVEAIKDTVAAGQNVMISGFGRFLVRKKGARTGRNPHTGEPVQIAARTVMTFRPHRILRASLRAQPVEIE